MSTVATDTVDVMFRVWRSGEDREPFALFPGLAGTHDPGTCTSYARVGQHSSADLAHCVANSRPATAEEYAALARELTRIGYTFRVVRRSTRRHLEARAEQTQ